MIDSERKAEWMEGKVRELKAYLLCVRETMGRARDVL